MKISLIRTGGILPIIKKAQTELHLDDNDLDELISSIKADDSPGKMRDNTRFQLEYKDQTVSIDLEKVPPQYKEVFEQLKDNLKIVKPE